MGRARPPRKSIRDLYLHKETKTGALILIVCEGAKTEPAYFQGLSNQWKLHNARVEICGEECASDPKQIVEYAIARRDARRKESPRGGDPEYDQVWCVFDRDQHVHLAAALKQAMDQGISVALSSPCFEVWYLLHFAYSTRGFRDAAGVIKELRSHIRHEYVKAKPPLDVLLPRISEAITNAVRLSQHNADTNSSNPYTDVHLLIRQLQK